MRFYAPPVLRNTLEVHLGHLVRNHFFMILGAQTPLRAGSQGDPSRFHGVFGKLNGYFKEILGLLPRGLRSWEFFDVVELKKLGNPYLGVFGSIFEVQRSILGVFFGYFGPGGDRSGLDPF